MMSGDLPFWTGMADMMGAATPTIPGWPGLCRGRIPGVRFADGPRGVIMDGGTTFPVSMGRGATFDPSWKNGWAT